MTLQHIVITIAIISLAASVSAKTGSTIYTPERVANARRNIERYDWAKKLRDDAVKKADRYVNQPDDFLWELITPQSIPRGIEVNMKKGCPNCGKAIAKFGNYPWKVDVFAKPWKIECPSCAEVFPKNDFAKFYESGKDASGIFQYDKADRTLLFNTDHPDPKDPLHSYAVDDTMGWNDGKGNTYRMIGYYGQYGTWAAALDALNCFRDAYVYTGDMKYARKAGLMLYRIAEFYPSMNYNYWSKLGFYNSDGGTGLGNIFGCIWETSVADTFSLAYDGIYPALDDSEMLAKISSRAGKTMTAADLRALVAKNILHPIHDSILISRIEGNEGMYQNTMTNAAVVLDEPGITDQWLDWVFADGEVRRDAITGGNMGRIFAQKVDADGMGNEASPAYNSIWRVLFRQISETLQVYGRYKQHSFVDLPAYRKMFEAPIRLTCIDKFSPHIGDTGSTGSRGLAGTSLPDTLYAYSTFKDPIFARMAFYLNGNKADGLRGGIFDAEPEAVSKEIAAEVKKHGPYVLRTDNMSNYGCAVLRSGDGSNARALSLYYGRNTGHGHKDTLNIELFGFGLNLMPDLGYPEFASADWPSRFEWTSHTISHNTVIVDRVWQQRNVCGKANFVTEGKGVAAAEVFASEPYPQTSLYQRTVAMVDVSPELGRDLKSHPNSDSKDFYVVDIFRVKGGDHHMYGLHGAEGEVETDGLKLVDQAKGTLAGVDVEPYADLGFAKENWSKSTGYQYLYDVRRDIRPSAQPSITYKVVDTWGLLTEPKDIRLRVNLLSPPGEVILAHGDPPRNKPGNPKNLTYILLPNKTGDATAPASGSGTVAPRASESTFVSVIEPYVGARTISKIERKDDGDTVTITITTASGRVDTIVSALKPIKTRIAGLKVSGKFAVVSKANGKAEVKLVVPGGTK